MSMDLLLTSGNDLDLSTYKLRFATEDTYIAQKLGVKLRTVLGEWFLDITKGVPHFEDIFGKNKDPAHSEAILKAKILESPGVVKITSFDMNLSETRELTVDFSVKADTGELISITETL